MIHNNGLAGKRKLARKYDLARICRRHLRAGRRRKLCSVKRIRRGIQALHVNACTVLKSARNGIRTLCRICELSCPELRIFALCAKLGQRVLPLFKAVACKGALQGFVCYYNGLRAESSRRFLYRNIDCLNIAVLRRKRQRMRSDGADCRQRNKRKFNSLVGLVVDLCRSRYSEVVIHNKAFAVVEV